MFRSILLSVLALAGCAKRSAESTAPEAHGMSAGADIDMLERELAGREAQLRSIGVATPGGAAQAAVREEAEVRGGDAQARDAVSAKSAGAVPAGEAQAAPTSASPPTSSPAEPAPRCVTVCELSASICQLQDRICDLAPRHPGEPRYQAACERATLDCTMSTEACHACS